MAKYVKEDRLLECVRCHSNEFEFATVDDGKTIVYVCSECGTHYIEENVLNEVKE